MDTKTPEKEPLDAWASRSRTILLIATGLLILLPFVIFALISAGGHSKP